MKYGAAVTVFRQIQDPSSGMIAEPVKVAAIGFAGLNAARVVAHHSVGSERVPFMRAQRKSSVRLEYVQLNRIVYLHTSYLEGS